MGISVSGLSSGFDWESMVEQLREVENSKVTLLEEQQTTYKDKLSAWQTIAGYLTSLQSAADDLTTIDDFSEYAASLKSSSSSVDAEDILTASTTSKATTGTYKVVVNNVAQEEKLASNSYASYTSSLGLSGTMLINGQAVTVSADDSLEDLQTSINAVNSGDEASGVVASILKESGGGYRLVLTSETEGADGIGLLSGSSGDTLLAELGFNDGGTTLKNSVTNGARSDRFLNTTDDPVSSTSVADLLGITGWSGDVTINGVTTTIDLTKTLSEIASDLTTDGLSAQVVKEYEDGKTYYSLQIANMTESSYTDDNNVLETLGVIKGTHGDVTGVTSSTANTTYDEATQKQGTITSSTLITDIYGYLSNDPVNDKITISGTDHDGNTVAATDLTITDATTMQDLLDQIESAFGDVTATVNGAGKIEVADNATGTSLLSVDLQTTLSDSSSVLDFGSFSSVGTIRSRTLQAGEDAEFTVDGTSYTSSTNTVDDVITGVTLNLQNEDPATTITVNVKQDSESIEEKVNSFVSSYNTLLAYINNQMEYDTDSEETGGPLFGDNTLKSIKRQLQSTVLSKIDASEFEYFSNIGITINEDGLLTLDSDDFQDALDSNFDAVAALFANTGSSSLSGVSYLYSTDSTKSGTYNITFATSGASVTGTIDGITGGSSGNVLIANDSSSGAYGLQIQYTGASAPVSGTFTFSRGIASLVESITESLNDSVDGTVSMTEEGIQDTIDELDDKIESTSDLIDRKMSLLTSKFQSMETALSEMQAISSYLSALLSSSSS